MAHGNTTQFLTYDYASPERLSNFDYGKPSDMWSIGCILFMLCLFKLPFKSIKRTLAVNYNRKSLDKIHPFFKEIIQDLLILKPKHRIDANKLCKRLNDAKNDTTNTFD